MGGDTVTSVLVPTSLLTDRIDTRPLATEGSEGPVMGDWRTGVRARVEGRRRVVRSGGGADRTSTQTVTVRPGDEVPAESQVRWPAGSGDLYEVAEVIPMTGLRGPAGFQLVLV